MVVFGLVWYTQPTYIKPGYFPYFGRNVWKLAALKSASGRAVIGCSIRRSAAHSAVNEQVCCGSRHTPCQNKKEKKKKKDLLRYQETIRSWEKYLEASQLPSDIEAAVPAHVPAELPCQTRRHTLFSRKESALAKTYFVSYWSYTVNNACLVKCHPGARCRARCRTGGGLRFSIDSLGKTSPYPLRYPP